MHFLFFLLCYHTEKGTVCKEREIESGSERRLGTMKMKTDGFKKIYCIAVAIAFVAIAGIVIGCVAFLALAAFGVIFLLRKKA